LLLVEMPEPGVLRKRCAAPTWLFQG
jgi:hypothetical protein